MSDRIDLLHEGQKACLRQVASGTSQSKEIAKTLNLSPQTVDEYLHRASKLLGTNGRMETALRFVELEKNSQPGSQLRTNDLVSTVQPRPFSLHGAESTTTHPGVQKSFFKLPPIGGGLADGDWRFKMLAILHIAAISAIVLFGIALLIAGVSQTFG